MRAKSGSWSRAFLAEIVETGDKNRDVPQRNASFCEVSLGKIGAKDVELFKLSLYANESCDDDGAYFRL